MARQSSRTTMPTPGGCGPTRLLGKELQERGGLVKRVRKLRVRHDMGCGFEEGVIYIEVNTGQPLGASQRNTLATLYFDRGSSLSEKYLKKGLEQMAEIRRDEKDIDVRPLKRGMNKMLPMSKSMSNIRCIITISIHFNAFLNESASSCMYLCLRIGRRQVCGRSSQRPSKQRSTPQGLGQQKMSALSTKGRGEGS